MHSLRCPRSRFLVTALLCCLLTPAFAGESEAGFVSMFNGKDLTGWEGRPGAWSVQDGAITAQSTKEKPVDRAHYLMWRGGKPEKNHQPDAEDGQSEHGE